MRSKSKKWLETTRDEESNINPFMLVCKNIECTQHNAVVVRRIHRINKYVDQSTH